MTGTRAKRARRSSTSTRDQVGAVKLRTAGPPHVLLIEIAPWRVRCPANMLCLVVSFVAPRPFGVRFGAARGACHATTRPTIPAVPTIPTATLRPTTNQPSQQLAPSLPFLPVNHLNHLNQPPAPRRLRPRSDIYAHSDQEGGKYIYRMNVCGPLERPCGNSTSRHVVCQELRNPANATADERAVYPKGLGGLPDEGGLRTIEWERPRKLYLQTETRNDDDVSTGGCPTSRGNPQGRRATIYFECGEGPGAPEYIQEQPACTYIFRWKTQYACGDRQPPMPMMTEFWPVRRCAINNKPGAGSSSWFRFCLASPRVPRPRYARPSERGRLRLRRPSNMILNGALAAT